MILKVTSRIARWGWLLFLPFFGCSRSPLPSYKSRVSLLICLNLLFISASNASTLELTSDSETATAGFFQLKWLGDSQRYQLQESITPDFASYKTIYHGADQATVISGKSDGDYYYRISITASNKEIHSNIVKVSVAHHPLVNAFLFFIAGAIVFVAILIVIIKGSRQQAV